MVQSSTAALTSALAFSMVATPMSKSAHVARILAPPKKPTTRKLLLPAAPAPGAPLSVPAGGGVVSCMPCTTRRSHRTFSWTRATNGSTSSALGRFRRPPPRPGPPPSTRRSISTSATSDLPPPVGAA